jgi:hypothetical protein
MRRSISNNFDRIQRLHGYYGFVMRSSLDGPASEDVIWLGAGVLLNEGRVRYHDIHKDETGLYYLDTELAEHTISIEELLPPVGFRLSNARGRAGKYALAQAVAQTKQRVLDLVY